MPTSLPTRARYRVYCCGPAGLIAAVEDLAGPDVAVHTERFTPKQIVEDDGARAFTVCLASSGLTVDVGADQSILDALEAVGVSPVTSCREAPARAVRPGYSRVRSSIGIRCSPPRSGRRGDP